MGVRQGRTEGITLSSPRRAAPWERPGEGGAEASTRAGIGPEVACAQIAPSGSKRGAIPPAEPPSPSLSRDASHPGEEQVAPAGP
jgi:hypothetical protein